MCKHNMYLDDHTFLYTYYFSMHVVCCVYIAIAFPTCLCDIEAQPLEHEGCKVDNF